MFGLLLTNFKDTRNSICFNTSNNKLTVCADFHREFFHKDLRRQHKKLKFAFLEVLFIFYQHLFVYHDRTGL